MNGRIAELIGENELYPVQNQLQLMPARALQIHESPETAVARSFPYSTIQLLDKESRRRHYVEALDIGARVASICLERLPPESLTNIAEIKILPQKKMGVPFFTRTKGMSISFRRLYT